MRTTKQAIVGFRARLDRTIVNVLEVFPGKKTAHCNACGATSTRYYKYANQRAWCAKCGSSPRERFVLYSLRQDLIPIPDSENDILHVAPSEKSLREHFSNLGNYVPADLNPNAYKEVDCKKVDLTNLEGLGPFRLIYASHVMEHIPDDRKAFSEILKALAPEGVLIILVPLGKGESVDGEADLSGAEREIRFGRWDHVRTYGKDIADRLSEAGFQVKTVQTNDVPDGERDRLGLHEEETIFLGMKGL